MGFSNRTEPRLASQGGFIHRVAAALACLQVPPPVRPEYPPSALEHFGMLCLALFLVFALVLLVLPDKWTRRIIRIALCIRKGRQ